MKKAPCLFLCTCLSLAACGSPSDSGAGSSGASVITADLPEDHSRSETRNPQLEREWNRFYESPHDRGGALVIGAFGDVDSLNELTSTTATGSDVIGLLFLGLTRTNPDFSHALSLAESWEFSDDHKELTFHLRKDVLWHDGVKTTAQDVKFSHEKYISPEIGWPAVKWKQFIRECIVVDDHTVKFVFDRVYPYQLMDAVVGAILPKHLLEKIPDREMVSADFNRNPIGNGPFKFKEWKAQQYIELEANENFYRGRPPLDRVIFKVVPDQENLVLQLKSGQVDLIDRVPPRLVDDLLGEDHLMAYVYPGRGYDYIGWNLRNPLFGSKKVRQALTMAINRQEIIDALLQGYAEILNGPVPPLNWAHNPNTPEFPYDPELARKYLAEEGWTDSDGDGWLDREGTKFSFTLKTNKGNQIREDILVLVQDMLKQVGIEVRPMLAEWTVFVQDMQTKNFDAVVGGWQVSLKMDMTDLWHTDSIDGKFNFVSYSNPELDRLIEAALYEMDEEKARQMWWRAQEMIAEGQPYTFLYTRKEVNFIDQRFQNVQMEAVSWLFNVEQWWVPKEQQKY